MNKLTLFPAFLFLFAAAAFAVYDDEVVFLCEPDYAYCSTGTLIVETNIMPVLGQVELQIAMQGYEPLTHYAIYFNDVKVASFVTDEDGQYSGVHVASLPPGQYSSMSLANSRLYAKRPIDLFMPMDSGLSGRSGQRTIVLTTSDAFVPPVPEFSAFGAAVAMAGALLGILLLRRN
ncbi:MAG: hypothetical protein V1735_06850 [Nanoarchaeota archaeon]